VVADWYPRGVPKRTYGELCPVARSLDLIGERWTILIVRELLLGPKRFKDLLGRLPAMGSNRLADRLKGLQDAGVLAKRMLPAPAEVQVYELTDYGERLRPLVYSLGAWGAELPLPDDADLQDARAELIALGLSASSPPELSAELEETYEFHVGGECFHVNVTRGTVTVRSGPAPVSAELVVDCDLTTLLELVTGASTPARAARQGRASFVGAPALRARAFRILSFKHARRELRLVPA
jgi:DNA-binding HxlR family transcriptional regulator/putative sterol carrier protein